MIDLDDFMLFNACEDAREEAEREGTTEYPYCNQFWEDKEEETSSYWDEENSSSDDEY